MSAKKSYVPFIMLHLLLLWHGFAYKTPLLLAQSNSDSLQLERFIQLNAVGVDRPIGLAYVNLAHTFLIASDQTTAGQLASQLQLTAITPYRDFMGFATLPVSIDPLAMAVDSVKGQLFLFDSVKRQLLRFPLQNSALPALSPVEPFVIPNLNDAILKDAIEGLAFAPAEQSLYLLGVDHLRIYRIALAGAQIATTLSQPMELRAVGLTKAQGLAINPKTDHLFTLDPTTQTLYELSTTGTVIARYDLAELHLIDPQGFTFAPSADQTDPPEVLNLYIADRGRIAEVSFGLPEQPVVAAKAVQPSTLVQTVKTSEFSPASPDPSDIAYLGSTPYLASSNRLLISDGEVDEMKLYAGANLYETSLTGLLQTTYTTLPDLTSEPVGITFNPANGHLFLSDDDLTRPLIEIDPGPDKLYRTRDDQSTSLGTRKAYGMIDPEGVAFARVGDADWLFFADGTNSEVYVVEAGLNGKFDGIDDPVTHFDTRSLGVKDPEGIAYHPNTGTLFIVGQPATRIAEVTTSGALLQYIDIAATNAKKPAGLTFAPGSQTPTQWHLYIVDRNVDNNADPTENDGLLYEIAFVGDNNLTPTVDVAQEPLLLFLPLVNVSTTPSNASTQ